MESVKKVLPYLLIAIVFAVGGYFIGNSKLDDQGAALYRSASVIQSENLGTEVDIAKYGLSNIKCDLSECLTSSTFVNGGTCYINGRIKGFWADGNHGVAAGCYKYLAATNSQTDPDLLKDGGACLITDGQGGAQVGVWNKKKGVCFAQLIKAPSPTSSGTTK
jgi:hypothetical protein